MHAGETFTRWGRTTCPSNSTLLYTGVTAGGGPETGNGANMLCLSTDPEYPQGRFATSDTAGANIHRAQYFTSSIQGIASFTKLDRGEIPCAVCKRNEDGIKSLFYPGRVTCPAGFNAVPFIFVLQLFFVIVFRLVACVP
jgi:hypothetical protein